MIKDLTIPYFCNSAVVAEETLGSLIGKKPKEYNSQEKPSVAPFWILKILSNHVISIDTWKSLWLVVNNFEIIFCAKVEPDSH